MRRPSRSSTIRPLHAGLWLLVSCLPAAAVVTPGQEVEQLLDPWRWVRFSTEDGLPGDRIVDVADGDVPWAATDGGLAWYDGWEWNALGPAEGLPGGRVEALALDGAGTVWVSMAGGLYRGDRTGFEGVPLPEPWTGVPPRSLVGEPEGVLVLARQQSPGAPGLLRVDASGVHAVPVPRRLVSSRYLDLWGTRGGAVWVNLEDGLYRWQGGEWVRRVFAGPTAFATTVVLEDENGGLASFQAPPTRIGLWEWTADGTPRRNDSEGRGIVQAAEVTADGTFLVVYDSDLLRVRDESGWRDLNPAPAPLRRARFLRSRPCGSLWVGTDRGLYLARSDLHSWTNWKEPGRNVLHNRVHEIVAGEDGRLWIATAAGIVVREPDGTQVNVSQPRSERDLQLTGLAIDARGRVWVSSGSMLEGVRCFDGESWTEQLTDDRGEAIGMIHKIRPDRSGRLWFLGLAATFDDPMAQAGGVYYLEGDRIVRWTESDFLAGRRIYDFVEDEAGARWFGTSGGIYRWAPEGTERWWTAEGVSQVTVSSVCLTPDGALWFAHHRGGLGRIDPDGEVRYVTIPGQSQTLEVLDLATDESGGLWVTTMQGLHRLQGDEWVGFDIESGLDATHLWPIFLSPERIYVGSLGRGTYTIARDDLDSPPPRLIIEEPHVDHDHAHISWRAQPWGGSHPAHGVHTRYRLDGGQWTPWTADRRINLVGVAIGDHLFEVEARSRLGRRTAAIESFTVPPPFHRRASFLVPVGLLAGALIVLSSTSFARRRRDGLALRRSEAEHRRIMEEAGDGILLFDENERCRNANSRAGDLLGVDREALFGRDLQDLLGSAEPLSSLCALKSSTTLLLERRIQRADGESLVIEAGIKRLEDGRIQVIARDITERLELERERRAIDKRLADSQKLEGLGLLAGGVAHDFNNLLTVILGSAEEAERHTPDDPATRDELRRVIAAAESAGELTQQLLAYAGRGSMQLASVELGRLVRETSHLLRSSIGRGVCLELDLDDDLPPVDADAGRLRQVLINLVVNASEAIGEEDGLIRVATGVEDDEQGARRVFLAVADSGAGMTTEQRERIFDPFFTTKESGRGLGLAAVRGILRSHGGEVHVASEIGRGATFTLQLPVGSLPPSPEPERKTPHRLRTGHVLLVDDDDGVRRIAATLLERLGFEVTAVADGSRAVECLARHADRFAFVVLDQLMPGRSGTETLEALRAIRPGLPGLVVSGYSEDGVSAFCETRPRTAYLSKPFSSEQLLARLEEILLPVDAEDRALQR